ncbi:hypothetical protein [Streptomyces sp. NPDC059759]
MTRRLLVRTETLTPMALMALTTLSVTGPDIAGRSDPRSAVAAASGSR